MEHWKGALRRWEDLAFDDVNLYRERPARVPKPGNVSIWTAKIFLVVWTLVTMYMLICLAFRLRGCAIP